MIIDYGIIKDFASISEAYLGCVQEDAEGRNINRAEKYISAKHAIILTQTLADGNRLTPRIVTEIVRNAIPNSRLLKCKFLQGATRIYLDDIMRSRDRLRKVNVFDRILKSIANDVGLRDSYDFDLNGSTLAELQDAVARSFPKETDDDRKRLSKMVFERRGDYSAVKIRSFSEAKPYAKYADWCICADEGMYRSYTADGDGIFYFCLREGYENAVEVKRDGCPLDDYGLSMIAVCVNSDGSLNSCTTRWNHKMGDDGNALTTEDLSRLVGGSFYDVFKPRGVDDKIAMLRSYRIDDDGASRGLGGFKFNKDGVVRYAVRSGDGIDEYTFVCETPKGETCVAGDRIEWFDRDGRRIEPPASVEGDFRIAFCDRLKTLEGCPRVVKGDFSLIGVPLVKELRGSPSEVLGDLELNGCYRLESLKALPKVHRYVNCLSCPMIDRAEREKVVADSERAVEKAAEKAAEAAKAAE